MSVNNHTYSKKIWIDHETPNAAVYRNGKEVDNHCWILWNCSIKNQEKYVRKAHSWADDLIDLLKRQETPNAA